MLVEISDGRRGVLDLKTNTIRTIQHSSRELPPFIYDLDDNLLKSQKIRTVGGDLSWKYVESNEPKASKIERTSIEELRKISTENRLEAKLDDLYASLNLQARKGQFRLNVDSSEFNDCIPYLKSQGFKILEHGTLIEIDWSLRG